MALILPRVMRRRLQAADAGDTPERALAQLQRIQRHRVRLSGAGAVDAAVVAFLKVHSSNSQHLRASLSNSGDPPAEFAILHGTPRHARI